MNSGSSQKHFSIIHLLDAYSKDHMQLAWTTETNKPIQVINTQMAEFEIADIICSVENVTYKAGWLDLQFPEFFRGSAWCPKKLKLFHIMKLAITYILPFFEKFPKHRNRKISIWHISIFTFHKEDIQSILPLPDSTALMIISTFSLAILN